jgi:hypothetical protein
MASEGPACLRCLPFISLITAAKALIFMYTMCNFRPTVHPRVWLKSVSLFHENLLERQNLQ